MAENELGKIYPAPILSNKQINKLAKYMNSKLPILSVDLFYMIIEMWVTITMCDNTQEDINKELCEEAQTEKDLKELEKRKQKELANKVRDKF